jgi:AcrR family transcriptional regulator
VIDAARVAFAEQGVDVPLDEIARRAGVGAGTVYRHFPSKEALFTAVQEEQVRALLATAQDLLTSASADPATAFYGFMDLLARQAEVKRDLPEALAVATDLGRQMQTVLAALLEQAQTAGAVRPELTGDDLVALLKALFQVAREADPEQIERLRTVVLAGLRP